MERLLFVVAVAYVVAGAAPRLRAIDPEEPDALLKFTLTELQRTKVEGHEMDDCHGLEVASIDSRDEKVSFPFPTECPERQGQERSQIADEYADATDHITAV
ncbi:hypothetical protein HPB51_017639 [Rhipicephalus microplus]|uniref:Secreted protein n=1 Tax=Rhipicephalus microplus TaxID=6941 RepID=A0A9J6E2Z6_RHIMP|nr:hypothetical protein HPB51_017639 [Rhipicephalus microplus]